MKRMLCLLLCLLLPVAALAEGWMNSQNGNTEGVTDGLVYDAADSVGVVVNTDAPGAASEQDKIMYTFTPLEVVLVIDVSGSMDARDSANNKSLLDYAKHASESFRSALMGMNPASRIGLVSFSDYASVKCGLTGMNDQATLQNSINGLRYGGLTNTGDGFQKAKSLLDGSAMPGRNQVIILLTDGLANAGGGNPRTHCIESGRECAQNSTVYTIGLVGGMSSSDKKTARDLLQAGYERRYYEVDFDSVADAGAMINEIVTTIAIAASAADAVDEYGAPVTLDTYQLTVSTGFDVRVTGVDGSALSSFSEDRSTSASFGAMSIVDGRKSFVMIEGDYVIDMQGVSSQKGGYTLNLLQGESMRSTMMNEYNGWSHESLAWEITLEEGAVQVEDKGYSVLDPYATDMDGRPTRGLEQSVGAVISRKTDVLSAPARNGKKAGSLSQYERVRVLAKDNGYYFITYVDDKNYLNRGWVQVGAITDVNGFVPAMHWLDGAYTIAANTTAYGAPETDSAVIQQLKAGAAVTLRHVECSSTGEEWAYVAVSTKTPAYAYVPARDLEGWQTIAPDPFRVGLDLDPFTDELTFTAVYFDRGQNWKVYSAPANNSWRGAKGKAEVSTNDVVYVAGWVNRNWLLVAYETNSGNRRVGYVSGKDIRGTCPDFPMLVFRNKTEKVAYDCTLTDDPVNESANIRSMKPGAEVTVLSRYTFHQGYTLAYVQCTADSKTVRAFIPADCLP